MVVEVGDAAGDAVTAAMTGGGVYQGRLIQQSTVKSYVVTMPADSCSLSDSPLYDSVLVEFAVTFHLLLSQAYAVLFSRSRQAKAVICRDGVYALL